MLLHGVVLVIDDADVIAILQRAVVVERRKARQIRPDRCLPDPPVEVHDVGMVFLDEFGRPRQPVVRPGGRDISEIVVERAVPQSAYSQVCAGP